MHSDGAGIFLIHLDGTVTTPAALAALAADPSPPAHGLVRPALGEALGLTPDQETGFLRWLDLVRKRHRDLRWEKIVQLAPFLDVTGDKGREGVATRLSYRKLEDNEGNLAAIAAVTVETGSGQSGARASDGEPARRKLEIRDVLALAANPPETVGAFLDDARMRLESAHREWEAFLSSEERHPGTVEGCWSFGNRDNPGQHLFRELHMVKGNAGAFGFEGLAEGAQEAEDLLEILRLPGPRTDSVPGRLARSLEELRGQLEEIRRAMKSIAGEGQEAMARIMRWKLDRLVDAATGIDASGLEPPVRGLVEASRRLPFLSPAYLARKYANLVERLAHGLGKSVGFRVTSNTGDIHPESFARVDEALVHILRNMVDHGIETPSERVAAGKGEAEIGLEYVAQEDRILLRLSDDGRGMDPEAIAGRSVSLGLVTRAEAEAMDDIGKLGLIFRERFTTRSEAGMISGRGLGLALAARSVKDRGGNLYVFSRPGQGARFAIELPHIGGKDLP